MAACAAVSALSACQASGHTAAPTRRVPVTAGAAPTTAGPTTSVAGVPTTAEPVATSAVAPTTTAAPPAAPARTTTTVTTRAATATTTATAPAAGVPGRPLTGRVVAIDPGHNGGNGAHPSVINQPVWNGRAMEACDTTGTATDAGYPESLFTFQVATYLAADLRAEGATVVLSRSDNAGVGPCITERAGFANAAHADAAVSIHGDGGPPGGRGFTVLEPVADGVNDAVIATSARLGSDIRAAFLAGSVEPVSTYDGVNGIQPRDDLAGLNLSTVPKVMVECANMRNATDAALVTSPGWQQQAAQALARGITAFLS